MIRVIDCLYCGREIPEHMTCSCPDSMLTTSMYCMECATLTAKVEELEENIRTQATIITKWGMEGNDRARYLKALEEVAHLTKWDGDSTAHPLDVYEVHRIATTAINGEE